MLVELATERNSQVACSSTGDRTGGIQGFATIIGAPALADFHVLEAGLYTGEEWLFEQIHLNKDQTKTYAEKCLQEHHHDKLTGSCGDNPQGDSL